jgi:ATP-dependent DNA ligase
LWLANNAGILSVPFRPGSLRRASQSKPIDCLAAVDGCTKFRVIARKNGPRARLYSRPAHRFPLIVETLLRLPSRSCIIDGEAVACDDKGIASFNLVRYRRNDESIFLLLNCMATTCGAIRLKSERQRLRSIVAKAGLGIRFNEQIEGDVP